LAETKQNFGVVVLDVQCILAVRLGLARVVDFEVASGKVAVQRKLDLIDFLLFLVRRREDFFEKLKCLRVLVSGSYLMPHLYVGLDGVSMLTLLEQVVANVLVFGGQFQLFGNAVGRLMTGYQYIDIKITHLVKVKQFDFKFERGATGNFWGTSVRAISCTDVTLR
jgi:hypothetical protein